MNRQTNKQTDTQTDGHFDFWADALKREKNVTCHMSHVTRDRWGEVNFLFKFQLIKRFESGGVLEMVSQRMTQSIV